MKHALSQLYNHLLYQNSIVKKRPTTIRSQNLCSQSIKILSLIALKRTKRNLLTKDTIQKVHNLKLLPLLLLLLLRFTSFSQINELDNFRQQLTNYINIDQSGSYSKANLKKLKTELDSSFRVFVLRKDFTPLTNNEDIEKLKKKANTNSLDYLYSFFTLNRDINNHDIKYNINYYIGFFGLYDYDSPNIVTVHVQPYLAGEENYMIYYYSKHNKGTYFIKNVVTNEIVFEGDAETPNAPIRKFTKMDSDHYLIVEDMGDYGHRAMFVKVENKKWQAINAFKGKSFDIEKLDYTTIKETVSRRYLWIASNQKITHHMQNRPGEFSYINLNTTNKEIWYRRYFENWLASPIIKGRWQDSTFAIDDYFIGEDYKE